MSHASRRWLFVAVVVVVGCVVAYTRFDATDRDPAASGQDEHVEVAAATPAVAPMPVVRQTARQEAIAPPALPGKTATSDVAAPSPIPANSTQRAASQDADAGLPAEAPMVTERGPNARALAPMMKGDNYHEFLNQLTDQAAADPLAIELTELYASSAAEASRQAPDVAIQKLVCGRFLCAGWGKASSTDAFANWVTRFQTVSAATTHAMGMHASTNADGMVEYRFVFSNDPKRRAVVHQGAYPTVIDRK